MAITLDENALQDALRPLLDAPRFRQGLENLVSDPFFLAYFLASVSQGEALGEKAVGLIGQEDLAQRIHDLERQEAEERGHKEITLEVAQELFPEFFPAGRYRYEAALHGAPYYVGVLEENRKRLKERGRYSRLTLYLTTTFGYEVMVLLLYGAVAEAMAHSRLPAPVWERVGRVLEGILAEEETHLGVVDQHNALLTTPRAGLSPRANELIDSLEPLEAEDYRVPAELAVRAVVEATVRYAEPERYRAEIESLATEASHA
ncbi:MAG: hypothetical protein ABFS41_03600 [Myxococcota bacterium]